ncbi:MAG: polysaccharide deacetylase family protein [bacterium]|nr:polysaccharide deacetylase family protein [bacterium]
MKKFFKLSKKQTIIISSVIGIFVLLGFFSLLFVPRINLKGDKYVKIKLDSSYKEQGTSATILGNDISKNIKVKGSVDVSKPGKYTIEYSVKEGLFTYSVKRIVEVVDDEYPIIELNGEKKVYTCPNNKYEEEGYSAIDNYDGDITKLVIVDNKDNLISYTVSDSSNNTTIETREIIKEDKESPTITLIGSSIKYIAINSKYTDQGVSAKDNCDGDLNDKVIKTGSVDTSKKGTYKIKYEVSDSSGNKASTERTVVVYENATKINGVNKTGTIYLTFDDGPSSSITPNILKILKEKNVKATFFVINCSNNLNYLIKQEYEEGHTVALHSYTHNYKTVYSSSDAFFKDLQKISDKVKNITGEEVKIIRFPGGGSNTISRRYSKGIMTYLTNEVINRGYHYFDWNVSSGDAGGANTKSEVYKNVIKGLKFNRANIVLMHDFENNYKTLNALSDIIDYGLSNGYTFEAIDMTTPLVRHAVNN